MRDSTRRSLGFALILMAVCGSVLAQTEPGDDPSRFLANPELRKAAALVPQSAEGHDIRSAFNENVNRVRLMVLLSPT